jgi:RNA polymerase sigma-70 factor (ECF subfamily)
VQGEGDLVRRAQQGDQQAFAQLYEEHFDRVYRYVVLKIGDRMEAEDMTQQVFLSAFQSVSSYKIKGSPFASWLYRIAHNKVVDHLRRKKRQPVQLEESMASSFITDGDPQLVAEQNISAEQLSKATKLLTEAQQEVISLRFAAGLSIAEVAKAMGKSEGAIKALQHSAVLALRKIMVSKDE